ncbi:acyltransferase family protein [Flagellimonas sp. 2504JD1-5]
MNIVTGWNRIFFSIIAFCITIGFFNSYNVGKALDSVLGKIGHISYSIYLIHPLVFWYVNVFFNRGEDPELFLSLCFLITMLLSWGIYEIIEKKFIAFGKKLSRKVELH